MATSRKNVQARLRVGHVPGIDVGKRSVEEIVTVPPEQPMNEDIMLTRRLSLRRRRHLLRNRPDEPRELARDRGGDFRFGPPPRNEKPEAGGQPKLGFPGNVTHDLG